MADRRRRSPEGSQRGSIRKDPRYSSSQYDEPQHSSYQQPQQYPPPPTQYSNPYPPPPQPQNQYAPPPLIPTMSQPGARTQSPVSYSSSSSSSSYLDISRSFPPNRSGIRTFFTAPSEHRRLRKRRSRRLFKFNNSSSSSVNSDLAYGNGYLKKKKVRGVRSRKGKEIDRETDRERERYREKERTNIYTEHRTSGGRGAGSSKGGNTDAEILAIGAGLAKLARDQNKLDLKNASRNGSRSELLGIREGGNQYSTSRGIAPSKVSHEPDEDGWESASDGESDSSVDSSLAFGNESTVGFWPWGKKKHTPVSRKSTLVDPRLFGRQNSLRGIITEPVGYNGNVTWTSTTDFGPQNFLPGESGPPPVYPGSINVSQTSLQQVFPITTSDPHRVDAVRSGGSIVSGPEIYNPSSRPEPVPLQHPKPFTPVSQSVYEPTYATRSESGGIRKEKESSGRGGSLAGAALAGLAGAAVVSAVTRKDDGDRDEKRSEEARRAEERAKRREEDRREEERRQRREDERKEEERIQRRDEERRHEELVRRRDDERREVERLKRLEEERKEEERSKKREKDKARDSPDRKSKDKEKRKSVSRGSVIDDDRKDRKADKKREETREEKDKRREKRREERQSERGDDTYETRRTRSETAVPQTSVDPFQYQVQDAPFDPNQTTVSAPVHGRVGSVPTVVTVEREPDFSRKRSSSIKETPSYVAASEPGGFPGHDSRDREYRDREARDRPLQTAEKVYYDVQDSTAPLTTAAIAAGVFAVAAEGYRESRSDKRRKERSGDSRDYSDRSYTAYDNETDRGREAIKEKERDFVQEEADRAYRELIMARKIASQVIRSRESSPDRSVVHKYDHKEEEKEIIRIETPPEMKEHQRGKGLYDAPNADFKPDYILRDPKELNSFSILPVNYDRSSPEFAYLKRDPDADRPRPHLNLVHPTPSQSPLPEKQAARSQEKESKKSREHNSSQQAAASDVVIGPRGNVVSASPTASNVSKGVTWGRNETKHYEVESPQEHRDEFVTKEEVKARDRDEPKAPASSDRGWGTVAAGIGATAGVISAARSSERPRSPTSRENERKDSVPYEYRGVIVEPELSLRDQRQPNPPSPGPKPRIQSPPNSIPQPSSQTSSQPAAQSYSQPSPKSYTQPPPQVSHPTSPQTSRIPGAFDDDLDFTAHVAAALQDTGFDPNIVINDPSFRRRESPPGSNEPIQHGLYHAPFAETVTDIGIAPSGSQGEQGFVIGEVDKTPTEWRTGSPEGDDSFSKLSRKEQKKREKETKRRSVDVGVENPTREIVEEPESYFEPPKLSKKEQKKRDKEALRERTYTDDIPPLVDTIAVAPQILGSSESYFETPKKSKKQSKKGSGYDDEPETPQTFSVPVNAFDDLQNADDTWNEPKKSKKKSKKNSGYDNEPEISQSVTVPVNAFDEMQKTDDTWDEPKKSKKKSKRDSERYDSPPRSVPSSEVGGDLERSSSKKSKDKSRRIAEVYHPSPSEVSLPPSTPSETSQAGEYYESRSSRKSNRDSAIFDSADRDDSRSVVSTARADDGEHRRKKKSRSGTKDDFDDTRSVASAPAGDDEDRKKKKDKKTGSGFFGLFGSKSETGVRDESPKRSKDDAEESRKKGKKEKRRSMPDSASLYGDLGSASVNDLSRSISNGYSNGSYNYDDDDPEARSDGERKKTRSRAESTSSKKDSFLDNAGTLGAGVGIAGVAAAFVAQHHQQLKASHAESRDISEPIPIASSEKSLLQSQEEVLDPEIVQRQIRPSIDPQYGDLLPLPPSNPGTPHSEILDEFPELPDSRPGTPELERISRPSGGILRRSFNEGPMKSPSQSAIPLSFRLGNRSNPSSPAAVRSPTTHAFDVAQQESLVYPRSRPSRPTSWEHTKEYKPLYLVETTRRSQNAWSNEPEMVLPELPPSQSTSRSSSQHELDDRRNLDVEYAPLTSQIRPADPLSINIELASAHVPGDILGSQQSTPKAGVPQDFGDFDTPAAKAHNSPALPPHKADESSSSAAEDNSRSLEDTAIKAAAAVGIASTLGYLASSPSRSVPKEDWMDDLPSTQRRPSPVDPMSKDRSSYLLNSSPASKLYDDNESTTREIGSPLSRKLDNGKFPQSLDDVLDQSSTLPILPLTQAEESTIPAFEPEESVDEFTFTSKSKKDKKKDKKKGKGLSRSSTQDNLSLPEPDTSEALPENTSLEPSIGSIDFRLPKSKKDKRENKKNQPVSTWEEEAVIEEPSESAPLSLEESKHVLESVPTTVETEQPDEFVLPLSKKGKKKDKKKSKSMLAWDDEPVTKPSAEVAVPPIVEASKAIIEELPAAIPEFPTVIEQPSSSTIEAEIVDDPALFKSKKDKKKDKKKSKSISWEEPLEDSTSALPISEIGQDKRELVEEASAPLELDAVDEFAPPKSKKDKKKIKSTSWDEDTVQEDASEFTVAGPSESRQLEEDIQVPLEVGASGEFAPPKSKKDKGKKEKYLSSWEDEPARGSGIGPNISEIPKQSPQVVEDAQLPLNIDASDEFALPKSKKDKKGKKKTSPSLSWEDDLGQDSSLKTPSEEGLEKPRDVPEELISAPVETGSLDELELPKSKKEKKGKKKDKSSQAWEKSTSEITAASSALAPVSQTPKTLEDVSAAINEGELTEDFALPKSKKDKKKDKKKSKFALAWDEPSNASSAQDPSAPILPEIIEPASTGFSTIPVSSSHENEIKQRSLDMQESPLEQITHDVTADELTADEFHDAPDGMITPSEADIDVFSTPEARKEKEPRYFDWHDAERSATPLQPVFGPVLEPHIGSAVPNATGGIPERPPFFTPVTADAADGFYAPKAQDKEEISEAVKPELSSLAGVQDASPKSREVSLKTPQDLDISTDRTLGKPISVLQYLDNPIEPEERFDVALPDSELSVEKIGPVQKPNQDTLSRPDEPIQKVVDPDVPTKSMQRTGLQEEALNIVMDPDPEFEFSTKKSKKDKKKGKKSKFSDFEDSRPESSSVEPIPQPFQSSETPVVATSPRADTIPEDEFTTKKSKKDKKGKKSQTSVSSEPQGDESLPQILDESVPEAILESIEQRSRSDVVELPQTPIENDVNDEFTLPKSNKAKKSRNTVSWEDRLESNTPQTLDEPVPGTAQDISEVAKALSEAAEDIPVSTGTEVFEEDFALPKSKKDKKKAKKSRNSVSWEDQVDPSLPQSLDEPIPEIAYNLTEGSKSFVKEVPSSVQGDVDDEFALPKSKKDKKAKKTKLLTSWKDTPEIQSLPEVDGSLTTSSHGSTEQTPADNDASEPSSEVDASDWFSSAKSKKDKGKDKKKKGESPLSWEPGSQSETPIEISESFSADISRARVEDLSMTRSERSVQGDPVPVAALEQINFQIQDSQDRSSKQHLEESPVEQLTTLDLEDDFSANKSKKDQKKDKKKSKPLAWEDLCTPALDSKSNNSIIEEPTPTLDKFNDTSTMKTKKDKRKSSGLELPDELADVPSSSSRGQQSDLPNNDSRDLLAPDDFTFTESKKGKKKKKRASIPDLVDEDVPSIIEAKDNITLEITDRINLPGSEPSQEPEMKDGFEAGYNNDQLSLARQLQEEFAAGNKKSKKDKKKRQSLPSPPELEEPRSRAFDEQSPDHSRARSLSIGPAASRSADSPASDLRRSLYSEDQLELAKQLKAEFGGGDKKSKKDKKKRIGPSRSATFDGDPFGQPSGETSEFVTPMEERPVSERVSTRDGLEAGYQEDQPSLARQFQADLESGNKKSKKDKKNRSSLSRSTTQDDFGPPTEDPSEFVTPLEEPQPIKIEEESRRDGLEAGYQEDQLSLARQLQAEFGKKSKKEKKRRSTSQTPLEHKPRTDYFGDVSQTLPFGAKSPDHESPAVESAPARDGLAVGYNEEQLELARQLKEEFGSGSKKSKRDKKGKKRESLLQPNTEDDFGPIPRSFEDQMSLDTLELESPAGFKEATPDAENDFAPVSKKSKDKKGKKIESLIHASSDNGPSETLPKEFDELQENDILQAEIVETLHLPTITDSVDEWAVLGKKPKDKKSKKRTSILPYSTEQDTISGDLPRDLGELRPATIDVPSQGSMNLDLPTLNTPQAETLPSEQAMADPEDEFAAISKKSKKDKKKKRDSSVPKPFDELTVPEAPLDDSTVALVEPLASEEQPIEASTILPEDDVLVLTRKSKKDKKKSLLKNSSPFDYENPESQLQANPLSETIEDLNELTRDAPSASLPDGDDEPEFSVRKSKKDKKKRKSVQQDSISADALGEVSEPIFIDSSIKELPKTLFSTDESDPTTFLPSAAQTNVERMPETPLEKPEVTFDDYSFSNKKSKDKNKGKESKENSGYSTPLDPISLPEDAFAPSLGFQGVQQKGLNVEESVHQDLAIAPTPGQHVQEDDWTASFSTKKSKRDKKKKSSGLSTPMEDDFKFESPAAVIESPFTESGLQLDIPSEAVLEPEDEWVSGFSKKSKKDKKRKSGLSTPAEAIPESELKKVLDVSEQSLGLAPTVKSSEQPEDELDSFSWKRSKKDKKMGNKSGLSTPIEEPGKALEIAEANLGQEKLAAATFDNGQPVDDEWSSSFSTKKSKKDKRKSKSGLVTPLEDIPSSTAPFDDSVEGIVPRGLDISTPGVEKSIHSEQVTLPTNTDAVTTMVCDPGKPIIIEAACQELKPVLEMPSSILDPARLNVAREAPREAVLLQSQDLTTLETPITVAADITEQATSPGPEIRLPAINESVARELETSVSILPSQSNQEPAVGKEAADEWASSETKKSKKDKKSKKPSSSTPREEVPSITPDAVTPLLSEEPLDKAIDALSAPADPEWEAPVKLSKKDKKKCKSTSSTPTEEILSTLDTSVDLPQEEFATPVPVIPGESVQDHQDQGELPSKSSKKDKKKRQSGFSTAIEEFPISFEKSVDLSVEEAAITTPVILDEVTQPQDEWELPNKSSNKDKKKRKSGLSTPLEDISTAFDADITMPVPVDLPTLAENSMSKVVSDGPSQEPQDEWELPAKSSKKDKKKKKSGVSTPIDEILAPVEPEKAAGDDIAAFRELDPLNQAASLETPDVVDEWSLSRKPSKKDKKKRKKSDSSPPVEEQPSLLESTQPDEEYQVSASRDLDISAGPAHESVEVADDEWTSFSTKTSKNDEKKQRNSSISTTFEDAPTQIAPQGSEPTSEPVASEGLQTDRAISESFDSIYRNFTTDAEPDVFSFVERTESKFPVKPFEKTGTTITSENESAPRPIPVTADSADSFMKKPNPLDFQELSQEQPQIEPVVTPLGIADASDNFMASPNPLDYQTLHMDKPKEPIRPTGIADTSKSFMASPNPLDFQTIPQEHPELEPVVTPPGIADASDGFMASPNPLEYETSTLDRKFPGPEPENEWAVPIKKSKKDKKGKRLSRAGSESGPSRPKSTATPLSLEAEFKEDARLPISDPSTIIPGNEGFVEPESLSKEEQAKSDEFPMALSKKSSKKDKRKRQTTLDLSLTEDSSAKPLTSWANEVEEAEVERDVPIIDDIDKDDSLSRIASTTEVSPFDEFVRPAKKGKKGKKKLSEDLGSPKEKKSESSGLLSSLTAGLAAAVVASSVLETPSKSKDESTKIKETPSRKSSKKDKKKDIDRRAQREDIFDDPELWGGKDSKVHEETREAGGIDDDAGSDGFWSPPQDQDMELTEEPEQIGKSRDVGTEEGFEMPQMDSEITSTKSTEETVGVYPDRQLTIEVDIPDQSGQDHKIAITAPLVEKEETSREMSWEPEHYEKPQAQPGYPRSPPKSPLAAFDTTLPEKDLSSPILSREVFSTPTRVEQIITEDAPRDRSPFRPQSGSKFALSGFSDLPAVVEEYAEDEQHSKSLPIEDLSPNRDSAFVSGSPIPGHRSLASTHEPIRDSGVHLPDDSPSGRRPRGVSTSDDAIARLSWPSVDEEYETVDLHKSQRQSSTPSKHRSPDPSNQASSSNPRDALSSQVTKGSGPIDLFPAVRSSKYAPETPKSRGDLDRHKDLHPLQRAKDAGPVDLFPSPKHDTRSPDPVKHHSPEVMRREQLPSQQPKEDKPSTGLHRTKTVQGKDAKRPSEGNLIKQRLQLFEGGSQRPEKSKGDKYGELGHQKPGDEQSRGFSDTALVGAAIAAGTVGFAAARHSSAEKRPDSAQSQRSISNINRLRTPDPRFARPDSALSNRSGTPPLRRTDRKLSGDLRSLSQRSKPELAKEAAAAELATAASVNTANPTANEGRVRAKDMADVYDGFGEGHMGSPRSPTRPHSMRRRQSMQVLDLESKLEQLAAENRSLAEAHAQAERTLQESQHASSSVIEKDAEIDALKRTLDWLQKEVTRLTEVNDGLQSASVTLGNQHNQQYGDLQREHGETTRELEELRNSHTIMAGSMVGMVAGSMVQDKDREIAKLRAELDTAKERIRDMQRQILAAKADEGSEFLVIRDEDYFDNACQQLCQHVQQWVLRFSKFSDMRACRLTSEINNDKTIDRLDNAILDGSDVDSYLSDRIKRRDVFMSMTMTMVWEFIFTRYLFGMDREQRQKLKTLEKLLQEVGPAAAVHQWRATTLTLLSKREAFVQQREQDTIAVVHAILETLSEILPPPSHLERQIEEQLKRVVMAAVDLSIEMRTQRAEYMMLPPLQPEYDANGDLASKVSFNAALMNERSGDTVSNEELEEQRSVVRIVLFPLVVKKGDDRGEGDDEIVVCPAQVLVAGDKKGKRVRVLGPGSVVGGNSSRLSMQSGMQLDEASAI